MDNLDLVARSLRRCRTRSAVAELFAAAASVPSTADVWNDVARSWRSLADMKQRMLEVDHRVASVAAELAARSDVKP